MLVDRLTVSAEAGRELWMRWRTAYREAGEVIFDLPDLPEGDCLRIGVDSRLRFSQRFECKHCNLRYEEPEPRLFSFNNPYGACRALPGIWKHD